MPDLMSMEVAGVRFTIRSQEPVILEGFPPNYHPFLQKTFSGSGLISIPVRLELHDIPDTGNMTKIFDTYQSWTMYKDNHDYVIVLNPPVLGKQAVWLARLNKSFSEIVIYCSDVLKRETDDGTRVSNPVLYPLDQLLLVHILAQNQGALIHAAGMKLRGNGYIFPGASGAGKSTLSKLLSGVKNMELLSDDRMAVRKIDGRFNSYGTPWSGDLGVAASKSAPLSGIFFTSQGLTHRIKKIGRKQALEKLLPVTSIPWYDRSLVTEMLTFCEHLIGTIPAYELCFRNDVGVGKTFEAFVSR